MYLSAEDIMEHGDLVWSKEKETPDGLMEVRQYTTGPLDNYLISLLDGKVVAFV